jgi:hypothetical protein
MRWQQQQPYPHAHTPLKVSLCLINETLFLENIWGNEGIAPSLLTSAVDGGEWSASRPGCFTPKEIALRYLLYRRLGGPQSRSGRYGEDKNIVPIGNRTRPVKPDRGVPTSTLIPL